MKDSTLRTIFEDSFGVALNMNDTFYYACSDMACINTEELEGLEPVIEKYGRFAFIAFEAIKRGHDPMVSYYTNNPNYAQAKAMILDLMDKDEEYGPFWEIKRTIKEIKALEPKQRKQVSKYMSKLKDWYSFFMSR